MATGRKGCCPGQVGSKLTRPSLPFSVNNPPESEVPMSELARFCRPRCPLPGPKVGDKRTRYAQTRENADIA